MLTNRIPSLKHTKTADKIYVYPYGHCINAQQSITTLQKNYEEKKTQKINPKLKKTQINLLAKNKIEKHSKPKGYCRDQKCFKAKTFVIKQQIEKDH